MKQYDVCPIKVGRTKTDARLVVVLQHTHLSDLGTVLVAPLYQNSQLPAIKQLRPQVRVGRRSYVVAVDRMAAVPTKLLGDAVSNLETRCHDFSNAVDLLFAGF